MHFCSDAKEFMAKASKKNRHLISITDLTAGEIAAKFDMTAPSISHHLDKLKRAGLVTTIKEGQYITYSINTTIVDDLIEYLLSFKK